MVLNWNKNNGKCYVFEYRLVSDFLNYSLGLASDILAEWKSRKMKILLTFFKLFL